MANISKVNFNGEALDIKDTHAREQIQHLTSDNYTADVTGDYTVNAGNIAMSSANTTMHTTADRTIDTDGNDSVHIDGASTLNVGGLRTETFAGDKAETVTGTTTEKFANINTTVTDKWMVNFPSGSVDMASIMLKSDSIVNVHTDFDAMGDGIHDDTTAFQKAIDYCIENNKTLYIPATNAWNNDAGYILSKTLNIDHPMTIISDRNALLNWKNAHSNTDTTTRTGRNGATLYNSGYGINIDYGTYRGHKGVYNFGILQGDKSFTYPGGTEPSGSYWTGVRIANGDIVDFNAVYLSYWKTGILVEASIDETANNRISFMVCDDCETGIRLAPRNNHSINILEIYFNTIGLCRYGIYVESDGETAASFSRVNSARVVGSQIFTEYKNGACIFNASAFQESVVNSYFDIMELFNYRTAATTIKTGDTSTWYGPCVAGNTAISGNAVFGAHDSDFNIGVYNGPMTAGQPINILIGGWGNQIVNRWQKIHGTYDTAANLIDTPSETAFNGGVGGCLPSRHAVVQWTTEKSYEASETVTLYGYSMCLSSGSITPIIATELENYGLFDVIAKSDTYNAARQFFITLKFRSGVASGYNFKFLLSILDNN